MGKFKDYTGKRYGRFVAMSPTDRVDKKGSRIWRCRCDCGREFERAAHRFEGGSVSCGCRQKSNSGQQPPAPLEEVVVRSILFESPTTDRNRGGYVIWNCHCTLCGRAMRKSSDSALSGKASCQCREWYRLYEPNRPYGREPLPNAASHYNSFFLSYLRAARRRNHDFSLTRDEFDSLIAMPCHYCGAAPVERVYYDRRVPVSFAANGLDRVDSQQGYVSGNVVPCCPICNVAKLDRTADEFKEWIRRAYLHLNL